MELTILLKSGGFNGAAAVRTIIGGDEKGYRECEEDKVHDPGQYVPPGSKPPFGYGPSKVFVFGIRFSVMELGVLVVRTRHF